LAQSLVGQNVTIRNAQFTGTAGPGAASAGFVSDPGGGIVGLGNSVILSSGLATNIVADGSQDADEGPFPGVPSGRPLGTNLGLPGDADLNKLAGVSAASGFDATVLQFDFIPKGNLLTFTYVFGSIEYGAFGAPAMNNDSFGVFVNGKVASLVPGTTTPVGVGTVNSFTNSQFFINNNDDDFNEVSPRATGLAGLTTVMMTEVSVNPGVLNHIKFAVQDTGDQFGDSVVLIGLHSLSAGSHLAFKPFRYVFQDATQTYHGNISVLNAFVVPFAGPLAVALEHLPPQVTLVNATGTTVASDGVTVIPALAIPGVAVLNEFQVARAFAVFTDPPPPVFLSTFFEGYTVDILSGAAAQAVGG
jgi:hypothetical protein